MRCTKLQTITYKALYQTFYRIIEMNHLDSIKNRFDVSLRLKDIHLVFKVAEMTASNNNFSAKIANATRMSRSIFSNYLTYAEKMTLIKRFRDEENYKNMRIELGDLGFQVYKEVMTYYNAFYEHLKQTYSSSELLLTLQTIYKSSNFLSDENPKFKTNVLTMPKTLEAMIKAFDRVFFSMHDRELEFIKMYDLNVSFNDLRVLSTIEILQLQNENQPKYISDMTHLHFSTISSMLKSLKKKSLITRSENEDDRRVSNIYLTPVAKKIVSDYMDVRISIHDEIKAHLSKKAYTQIVHAFNELKVFTNNYNRA